MLTQGSASDLNWALLAYVIFLYLVEDKVLSDILEILFVLSSSILYYSEARHVFNVNCSRSTNPLVTTLAIAPSYTLLLATQIRERLIIFYL